MVLAVDDQRSGDRADRGQFADRNHLAVLRGHLDFRYRPGVVAERLLVAHHEVELPLVLIDLRGSFSADGHLGDALYVVLLNTVAGQTVLVDVDLQLRLSHIADDTEVGDAGNGFHRVVDLPGQFLALGEVLTVNLCHYGALHSADGLLHVVGNRLREVEVDAGIYAQPPVHVVDDLLLCTSCLPLLLGM